MGLTIQFYSNAVRFFGKLRLQIEYCKALGEKGFCSCCRSESCLCCTTPGST